MSTSTAAALLAKIASLGTAGKAAVGLTVAAGVVGAAAAMPAMAESSNDSVPTPSVSVAAEPTTEPTEGPTAEPTSEPSETPTAEATESPRPSPSDLPSAAAFGQSVAADARDGGVDGHVISQEAHARNQARDIARDVEHPDNAAPKPVPTAPVAMPTSAANRP